MDLISNYFEEWLIAQNLKKIFPYFFYPSISLNSLGGMDFEIIGKITDIETIAAGSGIRERARLQKRYGKGRWRKLKGIAQVRLPNGSIRLAEVHWYESHGIGKKEFKIKFPFLV